MKDIRMYTMHKIKEYTSEHDEVMNAEMQPVRGVYESTMNLPISVKVPHKYTDTTYVSGYDYDNHPVYGDKPRDVLKKLNIKNRGLCDYPRWDNTLRQFFSDTNQAEQFITELKLCNN